MDFDLNTDLSWCTDAIKEASSESHSSVTFMDNLSNDLMHGNSLDHDFFQGSKFLGRTDLLDTYGSLSNPFMPSARDSALTEDAISSGSDNSGLQYSAPQFVLGESEFDKFLDDPFPDVDLDQPSPDFYSTTAFIDPWRASTPTTQLDRPFKLVGRNQISFSPKSSSDAPPRAALVDPFLQNLTPTTCNPVDVAPVTPKQPSLEEIVTPTHPNPLFQSPTNPRRLTAFPPSPKTPTKARTSKARTKTKDARSPASKKRKNCSRSTDDILEECTIPSSNQDTLIKVTGSPSHTGHNQASWANPGSIQTTQESGLFNSRPFSAGAETTSPIDLNSHFKSDPSISHRSSDLRMSELSSSLRNYNLFLQQPTSQDINSWPLNSGFHDNQIPYSNPLNNNNIFSAGMTSSFDTLLGIEKPSAEIPDSLRFYSPAFDSNAPTKNFTNQSLAPSIHSSILPSPHIQTSYNQKNTNSPSVSMSQSRSDPDVYQQTFGKVDFSQDRASLPTSWTPDSLLSGGLNQLDHMINSMANFPLTSGGLFSGNQTSSQPQNIPSTAGPSTTISRTPVTPSNPFSAQKSAPALAVDRSPSPTKPFTAAKNTPTRQKPLESVFVNFTPKDSQKLLSGVAPSGSSKRKRSSQMPPPTPSKRRIVAV